MVVGMMNNHGQKSKQLAWKVLCKAKSEMFGGYRGSLYPLGGWKSSSGNRAKTVGSGTGSLKVEAEAIGCVKYKRVERWRSCMVGTSRNGATLGLVEAEKSVEEN